MHVAISPSILKSIKKRMASGRYSSPEAVLTAALDSLAQNESAGQFSEGEVDRLLSEGENSGDCMDGEKVLAELSRLRASKLREECNCIQVRRTRPYNCQNHPWPP